MTDKKPSDSHVMRDVAEMIGEFPDTELRIEYTRSCKRQESRIVMTRQQGKSYIILILSLVTSPP